MQTLIIKETSSTPKVVFDKSNGIFEITGKSLPRDAISFYQPLADWFQTYLKNPNATTVLTFELEHINASSSKNIINLLKLLNDAVNDGIDIQVNWCHFEDDVDTLETGIDLSSLVKVPFIFSTRAI